MVDGELFGFRTKPKEVAEVACKFTLRSPAVERYMHDDPHCDNLEDIFGDLAVTAMLVPLKRV